jgi:hypothetical protein
MSRRAAFLKLRRGCFALILAVSCLVIPSGQFGWEQTTNRLFSAGFDLQIRAFGARYVPPSRDVPIIAVLDERDNARLEAVGGSLQTALENPPLSVGKKQSLSRNAATTVLSSLSTQSRAAFPGAFLIKQRNASLTA